MNGQIETLNNKKSGGRKRGNHNCKNHNWKIKFKLNQRKREERQSKRERETEAETETVRERKRIKMEKIKERKRPKSFRMSLDENIRLDKNQSCPLLISREGGLIYDHFFSLEFNVLKQE